MEQAGNLASELEKESAQINLVVDVHLRSIADQTTCWHSRHRSARAGGRGAACGGGRRGAHLAGQTPGLPPAKSSPSSRACRPGQPGEADRPELRDDPPVREPE